MTRQSDKAYDQIKNDIVLGKLIPGSEHTEIGLAQHYKTGRAAVRVALTRLSEIRLVEAVPRRGFVIAPITANSIRDLFETRLVVEPQATRLAVGRIDVSALKAIDRPIPNNPTEKQRLEFLTANHDFHSLITQATGNVRLAHIMNELMDEMQRLIHVGLFGSMHDDVGGKRQQEQQHLDLIRAFHERDADAAERIARDHIETSYAMARERIFDRSVSIVLS